VESGKPASAQFTVKALRSIGGKVLVYDPASLQNVPLAGAMVQLKELSSEATSTGTKPAEPLEAKTFEAKIFETKTGETGAYIFRNLAAGTYTVSIENAGKEISRTVTLPAAPANIRDVDLNAGTKADQQKQ
jgi:hypothetical protein